MCTNWILPFIAGVFVGQEFKEAPKVRPYIESGVRKMIEVSKDIFNNAQSTNATNDANTTELEDKKTWWSKRKD